MRKGRVALMLVLVLIFSVVASGCLGGGGEKTSSSPTTSSVPTTTKPSSTHTTTGSPSETATEPSTTTTETQTTVTETTSTTETQTPTEEAYWEHPWEYAPINIGGETYWITYYKYRYKIQPNQSAPIYEYIIEKSVRKGTVNVCGMDLMGNKKDLGEQEVYEYVTVVNPVNAAGLEGPLTIKVWYTTNESEAFLYPWDVLWFAYLSPAGATDQTFVGIQFEYQGQIFRMTNPTPFQSGLFPCIEGDLDTSEAVSDDLGYLYMGWVTLLHLGFWYDWSDVNVLVPQSGVWADLYGHSWSWSTSPDGVVSYSGFTFKLVDFQWTYEGTVEGVKLHGGGKFSPELPLVVESEGYYSYKDQETGGTTVIYSYLKLEDLKLEKASP